MSAPVARCGCGREYCRSEWRALKLVGIQEFPPIPGSPEFFVEPLELRNCPCGSTKAVPVSDARKLSTSPPLL